MSLQATDIADLVSTTLNQLGNLKFTDLMSDYQKTVILKRTMKKNKMNFRGGQEVQFNLITDHNDSARFLGMYATDIADVPNVMATGKVGWKHVTWNWSFDHREVAMNAGAQKIVDLVKTRRIAAFGSAIIKFEQKGWRSPVSGSDDPFGIPFWVVKSNTATTTADGFNGSVPSGFTTVGNINPTTLTRWKNYATQYTAVSKDDLIRKLRRMAEYTDFEPLVDDIPTYNTGDDLAYYSNYAVVSALEEVLESQNENLGTDIASMDGKVMFRRSPIKFIKELDLDTTNPIYQINWGEMKAMGLTDWWMRETNIPLVSGQHTVSTNHTDCSFNWFCRNRRRNGVLATNTTMGY